MLLQTQFLSSLQHRFFIFSPIQPTLRITTKSEKGDDDSAPKGFGSLDAEGAGLSTKKKQRQRQRQKLQKGQRERESIIRRTPIEKQVGKAKEESTNESAFLLAWLGFGVVILVEGISLAASGFLPEQWDPFFVNYLYPSFTPTVFLFIAGAVAYGVFKYLQGEKITEQK